MSSEDSGLEDAEAPIFDYKIDWNPSGAAASAETEPKRKPSGAAAEMAAKRKPSGAAAEIPAKKKPAEKSTPKKTNKKSPGKNSPKKEKSPRKVKRKAAIENSAIENLQQQRRLPLDRHAKDPKIVAALRSMLFEDESAMTASLKNEVSSKTVWATYVTLKMRNKANNGPELAQMLLDGKFDPQKRLLEVAIMKDVDPTKVKIPTAEPAGEIDTGAASAAKSRISSAPKQKQNEEEKKKEKSKRKTTKKLHESAAKDPNLELAINEVVTRRMGIQAAAEKNGVGAEILEKSLRRLCLQAQVRSLNEYRRKFNIVVDSAAAPIAAVAAPPPPEKKAKISGADEEKKEKASTSSLPLNETKNEDQKLRVQKATRRVVISKQSIEKSCERFGVTPAMINVELRRLYAKYKVDTLHALAKHLQQEPEPKADVEIPSASTPIVSSAPPKRPMAVAAATPASSAAAPVPPFTLPKDPEGTLKKIMSKIHKIELVQALEAIVYDGETVEEAAKTFGVTAAELSRLCDHVAKEFGLASISQLTKVFPIASTLTLGEIQPDRDPQDYLSGIKDPRLLRAVRMAAINRVDPQEAASKYGISVEALQIHFRKVNELASSPATGAPEWDRIPRKCQEWIRRLEEAGYGLQPELREKLLKKLMV